MTLDIAVIMPSISNYNTPYSAGPRLTAWLRQLGHRVSQHDFGLELGLRIFCREGLERVFDHIDPSKAAGSIEETYLNRDRYVRVIDSVIAFLQGREPSIAYQIAHCNVLPEGPNMRHASTSERQQRYGKWGLVDFARHAATMMLYDLAELLYWTVSPLLKFDSYGEALTESLSSFDSLQEALDGPPNLIDTMLYEIARDTIDEDVDLVCLTCPFPGQLFPALRLGQWLASERPNAQRALGGGYPSTELRRLRDPRIFDYVDYVAIDDGELPLKQMCARLGGADVPLHSTFTREGGSVKWHDASTGRVRFRDLPAPDYEGVTLNRYLNVIHKLNRVSRIQNEGAWLKLTAAHGCYWKKCTFCDIHLPYIDDFDPLPARQIADQMDAMHEQTGWTGFHFTDEAAPPPLLVNLALELLRRDRAYRFWGNVRFDPGFTRDRSRVLAAAGMVAATGGIEIASEELLPKMAKGITIPQVVGVLEAFHRAGILTHAYLIHGFPGETRQDTSNSLEIIRQLMAERILDSGHFHQFVATAHAPVARTPELFGIRLDKPEFGGFAEYSFPHEYLDPEQRPTKRSLTGLQAAIEVYARGASLERNVRKWLGPDFPDPTIPPDYVVKTMADTGTANAKRMAAKQKRLCWLGGVPHWSRGILSVTLANGARFHDKLPRWFAENLERCHPTGWRGASPPKITELEPTGWFERLSPKGMALV